MAEDPAVLLASGDVSSSPLATAPAQNDTSYQLINATEEKPENDERQREDGGKDEEQVTKRDPPQHAGENTLPSSSSPAIATTSVAEAASPETVPNGSISVITLDSPSLVQHLSAAAAAATPAGSIGSTPKRVDQQRSVEQTGVAVSPRRRAAADAHRTAENNSSSPTSLAALFRSLSPRKRGKPAGVNGQATAAAEASSWGPIQNISLPIGRPTSPLASNSGSGVAGASSGLSPSPFGKIPGANGSISTLRRQKSFKNLSTPDLLSNSAVGGAAGRVSTISGHLSNTNLRFPEPEPRVINAITSTTTNTTTSSSSNSSSVALAADFSQVPTGSRAMPTSGSVPASLADLVRSTQQPVEYRPLKGSAPQGDLRAPLTRSIGLSSTAPDASSGHPLTPPQQSSENWTTASQTLPPSHRWQAQTICDQFVLPKPRLVPLDGSPPGRAVDDAVFVIKKGQDEPYVVRSALVDPFDDSARRPSGGTMSSMMRTSSRGTTSDGRKRSGSLGSQIMLLSEKPLVSHKKSHSRSQSVAMQNGKPSLADPFSANGNHPASPPVASSFGFLAPSSASSRARSRHDSQSTSIGSLAGSITNRFGSGRAQRKRAASTSNGPDVAPGERNGLQGTGRRLAGSTSSPDLRQMKSREMPQAQSLHRRQRSTPGGHLANEDDEVVLVGSQPFKAQFRPAHQRKMSSDKPLPPIPLTKGRPPKMLPIPPAGALLTPVPASPAMLPALPNKSPRADPLRAAFERHQLQAAFRLPRHAPPPPPVTEPMSPQRVPTFPLTRTPPSGMKRGARSPAPEPLPLSTVRALAARTQGSPTRKKASIEEAVERARTGANLPGSAAGSPKSGHSRQHSAGSSQAAGSGDHHGLLAAAGILESQRVSRQIQQRESILSPLASADSNHKTPSMTFSADDTAPSSDSNQPRSAVSPEANMLLLPLSPMSPYDPSPQGSQLTQASFDDMAVFDKRPLAEPELRPSFRMHPDSSKDQEVAIPSSAARPLSGVTSPVDLFLSGERAKSPLGGLIDAQQLESAGLSTGSESRRVMIPSEDDATTPTGTTGPFTGMFDSPKVSQGDSEDHHFSFGQGLDVERPEVEHKRSDDTLFHVRSVSRGLVSPEHNDEDVPQGRQAVSMYRTSIVPELGPVVGASPRFSATSTSSDIRDSGAFSFVDSFPAPPSAQGPQAAETAHEELASETPSTLTVRRPVDMSRTTTGTSAMTGASYVTAEDRGSIHDDDED